MKSLFENTSDELRRRLEKLGAKREYSENEQIFAEGDKAKFLPIVIAGRVKMIRFLEPGKEVIIGIFGTGEMFAVPPVYDGGQYPSTVIAMEDTRLLFIKRKDFLKLLRTSSEFSFAVIGWMCEMLRVKTATIRNLATASSEQRIGTILLSLAKKDLADKPEKISLRRQDIAEMAGLSTETAIRVIRRLAEKQLLKIVHGKVVIDDVESMQRYLKN